MENEIEKLTKKIKNLEIANQGILAEYNYVFQKREGQNIKTIKEMKDEIAYYKKELEETIKKLEETKAENDAIKNSKWWKLRTKLKGE